MSLWDRRPIDGSRADHVVFASAADMADRDPAWISIFFPKLNNELKNEISILFFFFWKNEFVKFSFFFSKIWKKYKKPSFLFYKKIKNGCKIVFNFQQKWKMKMN